jgi:ribosome-binding factor A
MLMTFMTVSLSCYNKHYNVNLTPFKPFSKARRYAMPSGMKAMSQRQQKVAEEVRHVIASTLLRGDIPTTLPTRSLTVVDVWVSADLRLARVFIDMPPDFDTKAVTEAANEQLSKPLRKALSRQAALKNTPAIQFFPV